MTEPEQVFNDLKKAGLITEVFDQTLNKKVIMLTPKGAEWYTFLSEVYGEPIKKSSGKIRLHAPKKETINKWLNKGLDAFEGVAKFSQQIDKMTGGKPKTDPTSIFSGDQNKGKRHGKKSKSKR